MRKLELEEIKQIQLEILDDITEFCKQNDIKFWIDYGTLLGAIRHKGYIPWDDDVDIGMLREDYDRFLITAMEKGIITPTTKERIAVIPYIRWSWIRTMCFPMQRSMTTEPFCIPKMWTCLFPSMWMCFPMMWHLQKRNLTCGCISSRSGYRCCTHCKI